MIKKVMIFISILFIFMSQQAFAHSYLVESNPKEGEVITEHLQQMTLQFNTKIEQTSTIELVNSNGKQVNLGDYIIEDNEIRASFLQPLNNDTYKVIWNIVGADGHPINGDFSFSVDVMTDEQEQQSEEKDNDTKIEQKDDNDPQVVPEQEDKPEVQKEADTAEEPEEEILETNNQLPAFFIPALIVVFAAIGIGLLWWVLRRN